MFLVFWYFIFLIIVPQEWVPGFIDLPVDYILFPVWILLAFATYSTKNIQWKANDTFITAFIVWLQICYLLNEKTDLTGEHAFYYIKWYLMYWLMVISIDTPAKVKTAIKMLMVLSAFVAIEGMFHRYSSDGLGWAGNHLSWGGEVTEEGAKGRVSWIGIFSGPGVFSVLFVSLLPFALQYLQKPFSAGMKIVGLGYIGIFTIIIYFSGSRGGFLGALAVFAIFFLSYFKISLTKLGLICGVVVVIFMLAPAHLTKMDDDSRSAQHRVEMWADGTDMVETNPLFGVGRGNYAVWSGSLIAHNSAIEIMGEMGFVGLFLWSGMIYVFFKTIRHYSNETEETNDAITDSYVKNLAICLFGYLACAMFVTLEYETFYIFLAMGSAVGNTLKSPLKLEFKEYRNIGIATLCFYAAVKGFVMVYLR